MKNVLKHTQISYSNTTTHSFLSSSFLMCLPIIALSITGCHTEKVDKFDEESFLNAVLGSTNTVFTTSSYSFSTILSTYNNPDLKANSSRIKSNSSVNTPPDGNGTYTIHKNEFSGQGICMHKDSLGDGSKVSISVTLEWPEDKIGLPKHTLQEVRKSILKMAFYSEIEGEITNKTLENTKNELQDEFYTFYNCDPTEEHHFCSRLNRSADVKLDIPFGLEPSADIKWYSQAVVCISNSSYENDGGNGCHSNFESKIIRISDGKFLTLGDYFAVDQLAKLEKFVWKSLLKSNNFKESDAFDKDKTKLNFTANYENFLPTKEGMKWFFTPYSIFPGVFGITSVTIKWEELGDFKIKE